MIRSNSFIEELALKSIGKRAIAMAWVLEPNRFRRPGEVGDVSIRRLAAKLGFSAPAISPVTAEFSRLTKITNQFQKHDSKNSYANN